MRTITAGVIGTGFIGPAHVEALRRTPGVSVLALASTEPEKGRDLAGRFGIPRVYDNWEALIADPDIQVVHNCTPNNMHFRINRAAILARKHIISEKPLTLTTRESADLLRLTRRGPLVNAVNFNYRFYPLVQQARAMVADGSVGDVYLVHGHYLQDWLYFDTDYNWRVDPAVGGKSRAMADIGSHWCDLVQFITGLRIRRVCADLLTVHRVRKKPAALGATFKGSGRPGAMKRVTVDIATEDAGNVLLEFDNGARGVLTVSQVSAGRKNREMFEIDGSRCALSWDQEEPNLLWIGHRERSNELLPKDPSLLAGRAQRYAHYPGGHPEGYPDALKNFFTDVYDFMRAGKDPRTAKPDFPTFEDGHRENLIVEAVLRSNRTRRWVTVGK
jgi:predicted dehydrogenase